MTEKKPIPSPSTPDQPQENRPLHEVIFTGQHLRLLRAGQTGDESAPLLETPVDDAAVSSEPAQLAHE
jgi:hypothetical protein